jgi:hypothetical protein
MFHIYYNRIPPQLTEDEETKHNLIIRGIAAISRVDVEVKDDSAGVVNLKR